MVVESHQIVDPTSNYRSECGMIPSPWLIYKPLIICIVGTLTRQLHLGLTGLALFVEDKDECNLV